MDEMIDKQMAPEVAHAFAQLFATLATDASYAPAEVERIAPYFERATRDSHLLQLLCDLVPNSVDAGQWLEWLEGGPPPADCSVQNPDAGRKPAARGAWHSAREKRRGAQRRVEQIQEQLAAAQEELAAAKLREAETDHHLRVTVVAMILRTINRTVSSVFAMGPAWTLMRAASGYLQSDPGFEAGLDDTNLERVASRRQSRPQESMELMDLLDRYCGDERLELNLHRAILTTLRDHHAPAAKELADRNVEAKPLSPAARRPRRDMHQQATAVRRGAPIADRHEVLNALLQMPDTQESERPNTAAAD